VYDEVFGPVVEAAAEVAVEDGLDTGGIALLGIEGGTRHVGNHGVTTAEGILGVTQRVILGCRLREPDITTIASEMSRLESLSNILLYDDGATCRVDKP